MQKEENMYADQALPETSVGCPDELMWEEFEYCGQEWKGGLSILWISQREVRTMRISSSQLKRTSK